MQFCLFHCFLVPCRKALLKKRQMKKAQKMTKKKYVIKGILKTLLIGSYYMTSAIILKKS